MLLLPLFPDSTFCPISEDALKGVMSVKRLVYCYIFVPTLGPEL